MVDSLDDTFRLLLDALGDEPSGDTHEAPFFNFVHAPQQTSEVRHALPRWMSTLVQRGWAPKIQSLGELMWTVLGQRRLQWPLWDHAASGTPELYESVVEALRDVPEQGRAGLVAALAPFVEDETPRRVLLLTDAALLHPWFRVRTFEASLTNRIRCQTVLFYPGTRQGTTGLEFLGFYPENGTYRSTLLGGY